VAAALTTPGGYGSVRLPIATSPGSYVLGAYCLFLGVAYLIFAAYRLRDPAWRMNPWWPRHPYLAAVLFFNRTGRELDIEPERRSRREWLGIIYDMLFGVVALAVGVVVLEHGFK
jgi:hypothetical protein